MKDNHPPTLQEQLGYFVGAHIWKYMPLENFDEGTYCTGYRKPKPIFPEEFAKYKELKALWFNSYDENKIKKGVGNGENRLWEEYRKYSNELSLKYLPHVFEIYVDGLYLNSEENNYMLVTGLINYLWNTDFCQYSLKRENITITPEKYHVKFEFKLGLTVGD